MHKRVYQNWKITTYVGTHPGASAHSRFGYCLIMRLLRGRTVVRPYIKNIIKLNYDTPFCCILLSLCLSG